MICKQKNSFIFEVFLNAEFGAQRMKVDAYLYQILSMRSSVLQALVFIPSIQLFFKTDRFLWFVKKNSSSLEFS